MQAPHDPMPSAPPTEAGRLGSVGRLPLSRMAVWSLVCGVTGLLIAPAAMVAIVLGIVGLRRLVRDPGRREGQGLAIGGIVTGSIGVLLGVMYAFLIWTMVMAVSQVQLMRTNQSLLRLHRDACTYAAARGHYPVHVAELAADPALRTPVWSLAVIDHGEAGRTPLMVGAVDLARYEPSGRADAALVEAVRALDATTPWYRFGDAAFVRLPRPTADAGIVFAWAPDPDRDLVLVITDDGSAQFTNSTQWAALWAADARARTALGLPAINPPPILVPARP